MCCRYACLKAAAAKRRARHADGSADDAVAMCSASRLWRCFAFGMHFCDPNQLIATKQRNKLAAANKALCYLTRGSFKEDQHTQASLTCVCLSLRLFVRTVWALARSRRRFRSRSSNENRKWEEEDAEAAIAESMRRIDRPPQAKKIWGLRRISLYACFDL
ncbi:hypothetical protein EMIHUDRAFT_194843 [Emiliania huxleyi CCMP1516]|uniref:Uncharacterized protein n=2 Tax=Emiliania huxleyi TaxID=2903 RepID=A0A0D3L284_EMIH1|nr:hypothetical protein EMIHUDRAFT_194843 [Emiliania huxleyi CCMP1516]EOD42119.1 hypothetical protein EMIHUDRAFT_194843 [Emiliania huxleyi CCMP1516]|eukprot:XP_005794548.1 hypothetical protein EMIHUDRAFT_194843 [Emiliania huxleyi CCMP1516]